MRSLRTDFTKSWTLSTLVGWMAGLFIAFVAWIMPSFTDPLKETVLIPLLIGTSVGLLQWLLTLRGIVNGPTWVLTTIGVGILINPVMQFLISQSWVPPILYLYRLECLSDSCYIPTLHDTWFIGILTLSLASGICLAIPTWFVFHSYERAASWSLIAGFAVSLGVGFSYIALVLVLEAAIEVKLLFYFCVGPIVFTVIMGLFLSRILTNPKSGPLVIPKSNIASSKSENI